MGFVQGDAAKGVWMTLNGGALQVCKSGVDRVVVVCGGGGDESGDDSGGGRDDGCGDSGDSCIVVL